MIPSERSNNVRSVSKIGGVVRSGREQSLKKSYGRVVYNAKFTASVRTDVLEDVFTRRSDGKQVSLTI